jgi:hypothetical protein
MLCASARWLFDVAYLAHHAKRFSVQWQVLAADFRMLIFAENGRVVNLRGRFLQNRCLHMLSNFEANPQSKLKNWIGLFVPSAVYRSMIPLVNNTTLQI